MDEKQPDKLTPHQIWVMFTAFQAFCLLLGLLALILGKGNGATVLFMLWGLSWLLERYFNNERGQ
jgi:hypothetical protein